MTTPTSAQLQAISATTEPVRAALRRDPAAGPILRQLEATAGAKPQLLPVPSGCRQVGEAAGRSSIATIPNGIYVTRTTVEDAHRHGVYNRDWEKPITWTTRIKDGRWYQTQKPTYPDQPPSGGTYKVHGDRVTFRYLRPGVDACPPDVLRWRYYHGELSFKVVHACDGGGETLWGSQPWRKVK